ncbi:MAG TPA: hypothetical protein PKU80_05840 [Candidatus Limiplasma sp.]|nr:hypothetical protein [Candidatus Limiplasma sp.]
MKRLLIMLVALALILGLTPASAQVQWRLELNAAFSMLEDGNPFLLRYNEITGAGIQPRFPLGLPYMFGGRDETKLLTVAYALETTKNFSKGQKYLYGFDCNGFTNWINFQTGKPQHDTLDQMIENRGLYKRNQLKLNNIPYGELYKSLEIGDYLVTSSGGRHIMMYIGTLLDYGFTAETAPQLAAYLTYPLVVHCGLCPPYAERYQAYIDQNGLNCNTTDGGVAVAIVGVPVDQAPEYLYTQNYDHYYFELDGYFLRIHDMDAVTAYVWFRMD